MEILTIKITNMSWPPSLLIALRIVSRNLFLTARKVHMMPKIGTRVLEPITAPGRHVHVALPSHIAKPK